MAAVDASGLVKRFGATVALDGVDLGVQDGEVHGLLGPNGAGKTTLLRLLFGLVKPDAGSIRLFGTALEESGSLPLHGVAGFVEDPSFYPYLSGRANLELLAELDGGTARSGIDQVLGQVGLAERSGDRVSGYSTGMRQRLGIAAAVRRVGALLGVRGLACGARVRGAVGISGDRRSPGGDIFSSEDRYGTWKMVLTRSCTRVDVFAGKVLAAATFSVALVAERDLRSAGRFAACR